ncbi:NADP-dependent phosphogluconate dehydrogenase [Azospirillum sp. RWY-5-1]|uniref:6-phosphogluconate dehydrogenase, decarboxylating n=1 Tax=Azospirillum oleiclasticum TaxID=2735135 RepID=A0ABX2TMA3_9PROT|nr:NADP-dependent phosphogluconate dehydrogenase [Azospirillum oleiclasticum]NYZ16824.1 NADP-dependent phosphogluconate dehydrogenase [Azospirillum oleiclasticum]NYZ24443.1 NADP-dependent phosphogluconate dehydrogenase [Azospirillum oleiclasticum]
MTAVADIAVVGLGVMGRNLAANLADHGVTVAGFDRDAGRVAAFADAVPRAVPCATLDALAPALKGPRAALMMVPAGPAVDELIAALAPRLAPGDILIDGGNSHFQDTRRRAAALQGTGIDYVGLGVSGGEEGARHGPSLMAGATAAASARIAPMLTAIAARTEAGEACFARVGPDGAGHFVKTLHNGIEYADMQLIAEAYHLLRHGAGLPLPRIAEAFAAWNAGELGSYLTEITVAILGRQDGETGQPMLDVILDAAGQKGTGGWASNTALDLGMPAPTIAEAVHARCLSALKEERVRAAMPRPAAPLPGTDGPDFVRAVGDALLGGRIAVYAQGFAVMNAARTAFGWDMDLAGVASVWRAGCIIRARLIGRILTALRRAPELPNLLLDPDIAALADGATSGWRRAVGTAVAGGVPVPAMASALAYWDGYRTERLWADMIQAQRDFFGAHGYRRTDRPGSFHTDWTAAS